MSQLTTILGGMFVDETFQTRLQNSPNRAARATTLADYDIVLTDGEHDALDNMMISFNSGLFDPCTLKVRAECPNWPCASFQMNIPNLRVGTTQKSVKKPKAKKAKPSRTKGGKKTSGKKAARGRKKR